MHPKNNSNGVHKERPALHEPRLTRTSKKGSRHYSEAIHAVMDEMNGTATSRRANHSDQPQH